jgi:hypothetical protein
MDDFFGNLRPKSAGCIAIFADFRMQPLHPMRKCISPLHTWDLGWECTRRAPCISHPKISPLFFHWSLFQSPFCPLTSSKR